MFDIGFSELTLIGVLALIFLGPKRLPEAARTAGLWIGRLRAFITNVRQDLDQELQGSEMEEFRRLKQELDDTRDLIRHQSSQAIEQFRALDEAITRETRENFILPEPETAAPATPAKPRKKAAKKTAGKKAPAKKGVAKKKAGTRSKSPAKKRARKK